MDERMAKFVDCPRNMNKNKLNKNLKKPQQKTINKDTTFGHNRITII